MAAAPDARPFIAIVAAGMVWAGLSLLRRPRDASRGMRALTSRRWIREDDIPAWARDEERYAWGAARFGRWLIGLGLLVLALLAATLW